VLDRLIFLALMLIASAARAQTPVFDLHVHLWKGEASLQEYEAQLKSTGQDVAGFGAMWFGGPNQALQGQPDHVRASKDGLIALAANIRRSCLSRPFIPMTARPLSPSWNESRRAA
jgi:hypothetical protein